MTGNVREFIEIREEWAVAQALHGGFCNMDTPHRVLIRCQKPFSGAGQRASVSGLG
jgi:hypothetical protein